MENTILQTMLNECFGENLIVDGRIGAKTNAAIQRAVGKLSNYYATNGYKWEQLNLIGIRTSDSYTDRFTDYFLLIAEGTMWCYPMSTKPSVSSVWENAKKWIMGKQGVAVLKEGQWEYTLQSAWWSGLPFLYQSKPVTIFRDSNTNGDIDRDVEHVGLFGINLHSWIGFMYNTLYNLSQGCQVFRSDVWQEAYPLIQKYNPDGVTLYTLINKKAL